MEKTNMTTVESTQQSNTAKVLALEEAFLKEMEGEGVKPATETVLLALTRSMERKKGMGEEEGQLHWITSITYTLIFEGRGNELYQSITKSFPEY